MKVSTVLPIHSVFRIFIQGGTVIHPVDQSLPTCYP